jgi:hypothetical protein
MIDFDGHFRKMLMLFPMYTNGVDPSRLGVKGFWTSIGAGDPGSITSSPRFSHCFGKPHSTVFARLPGNRLSL